ncbi:ester cyclase [bacterium]|nr:ester cyclase [bacterium]
MPHSRAEMEGLVRRWIEEGWTKGSEAVVDDLHHPDFIDHDPGGRTPDNAGFKQGIRDLYAAFPDFGAAVAEVVVDAETGSAAVRWEAAGTHAGPYLGAAPTGRTIRFKGIEILRIVDGRITERWGEWDGIDLLSRLGRF